MTVSLRKKTSPATKYRVAIRDIAIQNGWRFEQLGRIDRFTKGDEVVAVEHGPSNLITRAERAKGTNHFETARNRGKMFDVQAWLTGVPDPEQERYIRLSPEQVRKYESGQGIAKIDGVAAVMAGAEEKQLAPKPTAPEPKRAPAKKAPAPKAKAPAPKPAPRAAKTAPAAAAE